MKSVKNAIPIEQIADILRTADARLAEKDVPGAQALIEGLDAHTETLGSARYAGHEKALKELRSALAREDVQKARLHVARAARILKPSANDRPFEVKDKVSVTRTARGWHDGRLEGRVTARSQSPEGSWSYVVEDEEGIDHEVGHSRDMRPAR